MTTLEAAAVLGDELLASLPAGVPQPAVEEGVTVLEFDGSRWLVVEAAISDGGLSLTLRATRLSP